MIDIIELHKKFGKLNVLNGINIHFNEGQVTAIVGPNGSGKTTLIKSMLGLTRPDRGRIIIGSHVLNGEWDYRKMIGYMPQLPRFPENLSVGEIFAMIRDLRGNDAGADDEIFDRFNLQNELSKKTRMLSGGTKQKLNAAIAFLFSPKIYILDEPTAGLDPHASSLLKEKILREKKRGKTIIVTSHIMSELEDLTDDLIFVLNGTVRFQGPIGSIIGDARKLNLERAVAELMSEFVV